jgi:hypothetical protein
MFDRVNTQTSMHTYIRAPAGFTTRIGQQPLSAGCSEYRRIGLQQHAITARAQPAASV